MAFELPQFPDRSQVGYLDPDVAGEGQKVLLGDGSFGEQNILPPRTVMPDWSEIKAIKKYFTKRPHQVWPAWLYHPTEPARVVRDAREAASLGICYRPATNDERGRYRVENVWDWKEGCEWRPGLWTQKKGFDPTTPEHGKIYVPAAVDATAQQHALLRDLLPAIAGTIAKELQSSGPKAPANVSDTDWADFLKFKAWQKTQEAVSELEGRSDGAGEVGGGIAPAEPVNALADSSADEATAEDESGDREHWENEAKRIDLKVDRRWSIDTLKAKIAEAASDRAA